MYRAVKKNWKTLIQRLDRLKTSQKYKLQQFLREQYPNFITYFVYNKDNVDMFQKTVNIIFCNVLSLLMFFAEECEIINETTISQSINPK